MSAAGALLFARYAYPPNALGYCGPAGAEAMLDPEATLEIGRRAAAFEGAWSYLEMLAECCGVPDPLDESVVEAYWVGNELLDRVDPAALVERLRDRFRGQLGGTWQSADGRAAAHHSFQVFEVYPWARLLRPDGNPTALSVLQQCRIRTGAVVDVDDDGEAVTVVSRPLVWTGDAVAVGDERHERAQWSVDGQALLGGLVAGDRVTLHWDWVCDVVTPAQVARVEELEERCRARVGLSPAR